nr:hypothetical protein [Tanacetum cinerariifolium]
MVLVYLWWRDGGGAVMMVVSVEGDSYGGDGAVVLVAVAAVVTRVVLILMVRREGDDDGGMEMMMIRSMVIQKRVEDLQLGDESYQKKINVTKPETTRPDLRKKDPYTQYQDPQVFTYLDTQQRNKLIHSDELYRFSNGTLTKL